MCLAAGRRPDSLGDLQRSPDLLAIFKGGYFSGMEVGEIRGREGREWPF